jgi:hypothetical protein
LIGTSFRQTLQSTVGADTGTKPYPEFSEYLEDDAMERMLLHLEHNLDSGNGGSCAFEHTRNRFTIRNGSKCCCVTPPAEHEELRPTQPDNVSMVLHLRIFLFSKHMSEISSELAFFKLFSALTECLFATLFKLMLRLRVVFAGESSVVRTSNRDDGE